jgi:ATP-binding cassette subfamily B protein
MSFVVPAGCRVAIVGPSGVGKSTLASLILRLYDPAEGSVRIDGRDVRGYTVKSLRSQISIVLQDSVLFAGSVWDNIAYGSSEASRDQIVEAAKLANAHEFVQSLPEGYDTILGERGVTISNGQRQRIAIARAAVRRAPILILDEPTIGLDEENERAVIVALERLSHQRTTFLITHDLELASRCDSIVYLDSGFALEIGSHKELMVLGGRYAALYTLQARALDDMRGSDVYSG